MKSPVRHEKLSRAARWIRSGRARAAESLLNGVLTQAPDSAEAYAWRGLARFTASSYRDAVRDFDRALALDAPGCVWIRRSRACAVLALKPTADVSKEILRYEALEVGDRMPVPSPRSKEQLPQGLFYADSPESRSWAVWIERIERMYWELEYATVRDGLRRIMFRNLSSHDTPAFLAKVRGDGLHAIALFRVKSYRGFSNHFEICDENDPDSFAHTVVAKDRRDAVTAQELYRRGLGVAGHDALGRLLGFPPCCRRSFEKNFIKRRVPDPLFEAAAVTPGSRLTRSGRMRRASAAGWPECNVFLRYFGVRAISWIPCSLVCAGTRRRARQWLHLARSIDPEAAQRLKTLLALPLRWRISGLNVSIDVPKAGFKGRAPSYAPEGSREVRWKARCTFAFPSTAGV